MTRKEYNKIYHDTLRARFLSMYGAQCACCGETNVQFLTMEHIHGRKDPRYVQRQKGGSLGFLDATKEYRPDLYEVLCMNCNHALGRYGFCSHHPERRSNEVHLHDHGHD